MRHRQCFWQGQMHRINALSCSNHAKSVTLQPNAAIPRSTRVLCVLIGLELPYVGETAWHADSRLRSYHMPTKDNPMPSKPVKTSVSPASPTLAGAIIPKPRSGNITLRLSDELRMFAERAAADQNRTITNYIETLVFYAKKQHNAPHVVNSRPPASPVPDDGLHIPSTAPITAS